MKEKLLIEENNKKIKSLEDKLIQSQKLFNSDE